MSFTIGSLFDGSGGFPLAATMCSGTPKWASEIEPYPIAVTKSRFPGVKHLGSVTDIKGGEVEPVDVITFGSPCQDLSVAGKRAGLKHEANGDDETTRSGLFMEAVRIIKEMREATNGVYPRFALWENVPGAFSSNKGEDFRIVLEELIKIAEPSAVMPEVPKNGWPYADSYCGDGWSLAYRVLDAQFWGVPQRRRRIYLVADFRGECAGKVSFEREGLRGYFETGRTPWQVAPGDAEGGSGAADCEGKCYGIDHAITTGGNCTAQGSCVYEDIQATLKAGGSHAVCYGVVSKGNGEAWPIEEKHMALSCGGGQAGQGYPCVMTPYTLEPGIAAREGGHIYEGVSGTLRANAGDNQMAVAYANSCILDDQGGQQISVRTDGKSPTLRAEMHGNVPAVMDPVFCLQGNVIDRADTAGCNGKGVAEDVCYTLNTIDRPAVAFQTYQKVTGPLMANSHPGSYTGQDAFSDMLVAGAFCPETGGNDPSRSVAFQEELCPTLRAGFTPATVVGKAETPVVIDRAFFNQGQNAKFDPAFYTDGTVPTLVARGPSAVAVRYIVRRLTPTECARLQGFPDTWGHPDEKTEFTDEEYQFWLNVRNTHATINDKSTKDYTKDQILKWYNSLHTDSSEYKMWGNGIALPNALYVMQGIADVMTEEKAARRKWLRDLLGDCL